MSYPPKDSQKEKGNKNMENFQMGILWEKSFGGIYFE
jgi:hypothetical protein